MKKITLVLCLCIVTYTTLHSQQEINTNFATQMEQLFAPLDKTKVPQGILLDYGMEFTNVPAFNGTLTDSTAVNLDNLKQAYYTLISSRITNVTNGFVLPEEFETRLKNNRTSGTIALTGLYFKYSKFSDNALINGKVAYNNSQFSDVYNNGVWQNPYQQMKTFMLTTPIKSYKGLAFNIKLPENIFYTNATSEISSIQIDFDNGQGFVTIPFNQNIPVNYTNAGTKNWVYKLNLTNGTSQVSQSYINIEEGFGRSLTAKSKILDPHYITATIPYQNKYGSVTLTIDDTDSDGIKKPLIVAEGFDVGAVFNPEQEYGIYDYSDLRNFLQGSGTDLRDLIWEDTKEYDIIYVDWDNGVDYLQRNAYALEEVINYVNSIKQGSEPNVILGQSMGGVIARYALADMEERGENHDTRLFISHDAPQQGANVPLGLQYLYRHLSKQYVKSSLAMFGGEVILPLFNDGVAGSDYLSLLDTPATKQLLKNTSDYSYELDNDTHEEFYNELRNNNGLSGSYGYPINCRNIALSNGSECGVSQDFSAGEHLVNYQWHKGLSFWGDLLSLIYNPLGGSIGGVLIDSDFFGVAALGLVPGYSSYDTDIQIKSISYNTNNQLYKANVSYTKKIMWLVNVTVNITNVEKDQPSGILPYDYYGGGYFNVNNFIEPDDLPENLFIRDKFSFIPTTSSLDIGYYNFELQDSDFLRAYVGGTPPVGAKSSPFDNFSTEFDTNPYIQNKQHISFNPRNGDWLAGELNGGEDIIYTNCSFVCESAEITGADELCADFRSYYVPEGAGSYSWSILNGNKVNITSGIDSHKLTIVPKTGQSGWVYLNVIISGSTCGGSIELSKSVYIGTPKFDNVEEVDVSYINHLMPYSTGGCGDFGLKLNFEPSNADVQQIEWRKVTDNYQWSQEGNANPDEYVIISPYCNELLRFEVRAKNDCGWSSWQRVAYNADICSNNCSSSSNNTSGIDSAYFEVFPVPASSNLTVRVKNEAPDILDFGEHFKITLYNKILRIKKEVEGVANSITTDVTALPSDYYILTIEYNNIYESHSILIE